MEENFPFRRVTPDYAPMERFFSNISVIISYRNHFLSSNDIAKDEKTGT